ncbi:hypothetical protein MMC30_007089, partial [Trapelia coarctata]|nr:hypothetical protein [Trapelia coarctata]
MPTPGQSSNGSQETILDPASTSKTLPSTPTKTTPETRSSNPLPGGKTPSPTYAASPLPPPIYTLIPPQFKLLPPTATKNFSHATSFTSVCINTAIYLPYLLSLCLRAGVHFHRAVFTHISEAANAHHSSQPAHIVVNCTGLSARKLGGVMDASLLPARGQTVLVRNEVDGMYASSRTEDGEEEMFYVMQRAAGGGTLLGGSYQKGNYDPLPDPNLAIRIMTRAVKLCPSLTNAKGIEALDIIRHGVGLRPLRTGGVRLEKERIGDT